MNDRIVKNPNFKNNGEFHKSLAARPAGAKDWPNSHTEVEHLGNGKFAASIGVGHRVFFDKADGNKPKKHKLTDERPAKDYVLIQGPKCCVEVYPYYTKYFDVHHEEVRLYEERWVVQRLFKEPDTWRDVGAYNPQIAVEEYSEAAGDVVKVTITYDTDYGTLIVEYFQRDGNNLKHNITFKNTSGNAETFRVLQKWAGIVANNVTARAENQIAKETHFNTTLLIFGDGQHPFKISNNLGALNQKGTIDTLKMLTGSREPHEGEVILLEKDGFRLIARDYTLFLELDGKIVMSSSGDEVSTMVRAVEDCPEEARVFIGGLGLGVILFPLAISGKATEVVICEKDSSVIDTIGPKVQAWFPDLNITIIHGDATIEVQNHGKFDWIFMDIDVLVPEGSCTPYLAERGKFTNWATPPIQGGRDRVLLTEPVRVDVHPQGLKADVVIGNWTLAQGEGLVIDPDSATLDDPTEDGYITDGGFKYAAVTLISIGRVGTTEIKRGYAEWNISGLSGTVTKAEFRYEGYIHNVDATNADIRGVATQPSTGDPSTVYDDIATGTAYLSNDAVFPEVGATKDVGGASGPAWDTDPCSAIETAISSGWWAFGFKTQETETPGLRDDWAHQIYSEEYVGPPTPKPTLYVEYTVPVGLENKSANMAAKMMDAGVL